jgi:hypothetical protein
MPSQFSTGVVIAGYGKDDLYPVLYEIAVDGGFLDKVRCYDVESCDIAKNAEGAAISTFAQDDTVKTFLNGSESWSRLSERIFRVDKWSLCRG